MVSLVANRSFNSLKQENVFYCYSPTGEGRTWIVSRLDRLDLLDTRGYCHESSPYVLLTRESEVQLFAGYPRPKNMRKLS